VRRVARGGRAGPWRAWRCGVAVPGRAPRGVSAALACCAAVTACGVSRGAPSADPPLLRDAFSAANGPNRLITSEYALHNPDGVQSPAWEMTSGSFFVRGAAGWSGVPDTVAPDRFSERSTGSAVFRLRTRRASFRDVEVRAEIRVNRWSKARRGALPAIVLWVRYASERRLYWPSVLRADGRVDIEKKVPGGPYPDNAGTYYILPPYTRRGWPVRLGRWYRIAVRVRNGGAGSVSISTYRDGRRMMTSVDRGAGQRVQVARTGGGAANPVPAITGAGRLGIRGDNADFNVRSYVVGGLAPAPDPAAVEHPERPEIP
jgi:hypothetical protein